MPGLPAVGEPAFGAHAVDLLVVIEVLRLGKGRGNDHAVFRFVDKLDKRVERALVAEAIHVGAQHAPSVAEGGEFQLMAFARVLADAFAGMLRQVQFAQRQQAHGACRDLPALLQLDDRDGVHAHIAVVRDGQRQGEAAVADEIIVPFLDAQLAGADVRAAVHAQQRTGPARLGQVALCVQKRDGFRDLMLHVSLRSFRCCHVLFRLTF